MHIFIEVTNSGGGMTRQANCIIKSTPWKRDRFRGVLCMRGMRIDWSMKDRYRLSAGTASKSQGLSARKEISVFDFPSIINLFQGMSFFFLFLFHGISNSDFGCITGNFCSGKFPRSHRCIFFFYI